MERIKILIANDLEESRRHIRRILESEQELQIVGEASNGEDAVKKTQQMMADVVLMDDHMPVMDGITATEKISLNSPQVAVIVISTRGEPEYLRKAMMAGAREYLVEPFEDYELVESIKRINYLEKLRRDSFESISPRTTKDPHVITVFGSKGGVGKTTISVNLAARLAKKTKAKVALVDLDLQFGDVAVFFNISPRKSIAELVQEKGKIDSQLMESYLIPHISRVKILPAPMRPEYAELVLSENVAEILSVLKQNYDYIIVDTPPSFQDTTLSALELSQQILLVMTLDLPSIKNMKLSLDLLHSLNQKGKTKLILNRATENLGISAKDVEKSLEYLIAEKIPSDGNLVVTSVNRGVPFVVSNPKAKVSNAIDNIAGLIIEDKGYQKDLLDAGRKRSLLGRLFG